MKHFILFYRLFYYLLYIVAILCFRVFSSLTIKDKINRQKKVADFMRFISLKMMKKLSCQINTKGLKHLQKQKNYLVVANHVSYLDIPLLSIFIAKNRFISHLEMKENNPILNWIITAGGSYFIERRNFKYIRKELRELSAILKQGLNLIFFPEGTSTDGLEIKPFHPLFFTTAIHAGVSVLPVCIKYKKVEGMAFSSKNKDLICWYDDRLSFAQHLFQLLKLKSIEVELVFLPPIDSTKKTSRGLAEESQKQIQKHYTPPLP